MPSGRDHVELNLELLAGVTDRGLRHPRNEDAMALATTETPAGPVAIAVVCDGVSSSPNPEDASLTGAQAAVRMLLSSIRRGDDPDEASTAAVRQAHEAMAILGSPSRAPSATYVSAIVDRGGGHVCWLGDSRAYWLATESESARLTKDDSLAEELVAQGQMTEAEAMASPQAHVITRWLGADVASAGAARGAGSSRPAAGSCWSAPTGCGTTSPTRRPWPSSRSRTRSTTRPAPPTRC